MHIFKNAGGESPKFDNSEVAPKEPAPAPAVTPAPTPSAPVVTDSGDIQPKLIGVVVKHTGYPEDFIEMDQDLEGELGIDTVKQAEIMGDVREIFSLPVDEDFVLSEHPTLNHFVAYIQRMTEALQVLLHLLKTCTTAPAAQQVAATPQPATTPASSGTRRWQVEVELVQRLQKACQ